MKKSLLLVFFAVCLSQCKNNTSTAPSESVETTIDGTNLDGLEKDLNIQDTTVNNTFKGFFKYFADAAVFKPCDEERYYVVVMGYGDYLNTEKAYLNDVEGGTDCFIEFEGEVTESSNGEDNSPLVKAYKITKLIELNQYRSCVTEEGLK